MSHGDADKRQAGKYKYVIIFVTSILREQRDDKNYVTIQWTLHLRGHQADVPEISISGFFYDLCLKLLHVIQPL